MNTALRVLCLAGPTGAGKTAAALALAQAVDGEVINADSRQTYADFPVITAQPAAEERAVCPHHLYGFLDSSSRLSAGRWADMATDKAREAIARGKVPLLVGGTGLYFKAILEGIATIPSIDAAVSAGLTARCAAEGPEALHTLLCTVDPVYAERIHPHDRQRIVRALEVFESTGKPFSWWHLHAMPAPLCTGLYMGLDITLAALEGRLATRIEAMLGAGAVDEARRAWEHCADDTAPGWSGIGCAELHRHLAGSLSLDEAQALWLRNTRAYAKRQLTWFRAVPDICWFAPDAMEDLCAAAQFFLHN